MIFCVLVGTGVQLIACTFLLILFSAAGFLSPANRGSIMIGMLIFFVLMGSLAGFTSARLYKTFKGKQWQKCTVLTAVLFPGVAFLGFFVLNTIIWSYGSTGAVPFLTMLSILTLWFGISLPLVFLGAYFGYKQETIEFPVVTSNIPRPIPEQPWYLQPILTGLLGGILPFGACFVELFFIMSSIWMDQYYYVFGFLLLVFLILAITCAEIAIVMNYFQLCSEDYRWWWRSLTVPGSTAIYVFLYSVIYVSRLQSTMYVTYLLYFSYMALISLGVFLVTGKLFFLSFLIVLSRIRHLSFFLSLLQVPLVSLLVSISIIKSMLRSRSIKNPEQQQNGRNFFNNPFQIHSIVTKTQTIENKQSNNFYSPLNPFFSHFLPSFILEPFFPPLPNQSQNK